MYAPVVKRAFIGLNNVDQNLIVMGIPFHWETSKGALPRLLKQWGQRPSSDRWKKQFSPSEQTLGEALG